MAEVRMRGERVLHDPPFAKWLTNNLRAAWLWLRLWLGCCWVKAASHKVANPAWVSTGEALKGFWTAAVQIPEGGRPAITFDGYRSFIMTLLETEAHTWFGKLIAYGELLVGIALILGAFTGIAAFFGAVMNFNFMLAGSASSNPLLFLIAIGLILAWKVAGYIGADYFLLRWIGVPWRWEFPSGAKSPSMEASQA